MMMVTTTRRRILVAAGKQQYGMGETNERAGKKGKFRMDSSRWVKLTSSDGDVRNGFLGVHFALVAAVCVCVCRSVTDVMRRCVPLESEVGVEGGREGGKGRGGVRVVKGHHHVSKSNLFNYLNLAALFSNPLFSSLLSNFIFSQRASSSPPPFSLFLSLLQTRVVFKRCCCYCLFLLLALILWLVCRRVFSWLCILLSPYLLSLLIFVSLDDNVVSQSFLMLFRLFLLVTPPLPFPRPPLTWTSFLPFSPLFWPLVHLLLLSFKFFCRYLLLSVCQFYSVHFPLNSCSFPVVSCFHRCSLWISTSSSWILACSRCVLPFPLHSAFPFYPTLFKAFRCLPVFSFSVTFFYLMPLCPVFGLLSFWNLFCRKFHLLLLSGPWPVPQN